MKNVVFCLVALGTIGALAPIAIFYVGKELGLGPSTSQTSTKSQTVLEPIEAGQEGFGEAKDPFIWQAIDRHALETPAEVEKTTGTLSQYLTKPARNDRDKARAIYRWLTDRVAYDTQSFFGGTFGDVTAEAVLMSRKSVCAGYAELFQRLATEAGLKSVVVTGFGKGYGYQAGDMARGSNHAWNAIQLGSGWYLVDATWGAGGIDEHKQFEKEFRNHYFLPSPDEFILTHFPDDPRWQLLTPRVSLEEFRRWPKVDEELLEQGISAKDIRKRLQGGRND